MSNFDEDRLRQLVKQTCQHPPGSLERREGMTEIVQIIQKSGKLWKDSSRHYQDALQRTWLYFCRNLCESTTASQFDPARASVITWLNGYIKGELKKGGSEDKKELLIKAPTIVADDGIQVEAFTVVPAPPDMPPMLETTKEWVEADPTGELGQIHLKENPRVTGQIILLRRLPPDETPWKDLSKEFNIPIPTLSTFYRRQCLPRLRQFGEEQGYL